MFLNVTKLLSLSESAKVPFSPGEKYEDTLPGVSLTEATAMIPRVIMESQLELLRNVDDTNTALVEEVVRAVTLQESAQLEPITESAVSKLTDFIKAFFQKVISMLKSVVAKIKAKVDVVIKDSKELWNKYGEMLKNATIDRKVMVSGYSFPNVEYTDPRKLLSEEAIGDIAGVNQGNVTVSPGGFEKVFSSVTKGTPRDEVANDWLSAFEERSSSKRKQLTVEKLVDFDVDEDDIERSLINGIRGQIKDYTWGQGPFCFDWIKNTMLNMGTYFGQILKCYHETIDALEDYEDKLLKSVKRLTERQVDDGAGGDTQARGASLAVAYYNRWLAATGDVVSGVTMVMNARTQSMYTRFTQAGEFIRKAIASAKKGGKNEDTGDLSDFDDWDVAELEY